MISDERLKQISKGDIHMCTPDLAIKMARELLALRKAFSEPAAYEVKGLLCHTLEKAEIYAGESKPLYRGPE